MLQSLKTVSCSLSLLLGSSLAPSADARPQAGSSCVPGWEPTHGGSPGVGDRGGLPPGEFAKVRALELFDDGTGGGPALYAGGDFGDAGGVPSSGVARWDGRSWSSFGAGASVADVRALEVFDDGSGNGTELYVAGVFWQPGVGATDYIARWDGASWQSLGAGVDGQVFALEVFDDGSGPALYAGGWFTNAGGAPAAYVAKWDGSQWSALGTGADWIVSALRVFDDGLGGGPALYVGGSFTQAGGVQEYGIARWDGSTWSSVGGGLWWGAVHALEVFDDGLGAGPALIAAGEFQLVGGVSASRIAKWDGSAWSALGAGVDEVVHALEVYDDGAGGGPALYVGGAFGSAGGSPAKRLARWDGVGWSALGAGVDGLVFALGGFDGAGAEGPRLYAGGDFGLTGDELARSFAAWDGSAWSPIGHGADDEVIALEALDDGNGVALYASGNFTSIDGVLARRLARWDGVQWTPLGNGISGLFWSAKAIAAFDDGLGGGPHIYVGGSFPAVGGVLANNVARWDGAAWAPVGGGLGVSTVTALEVYDDGSSGGRELYVSGSFLTAGGGVDARHVARWNGASWSAVGAGLGGEAYDMAAFDDGTGGGRALYAGGSFEDAFGNAIAPVERWDGSSWSPVGTGLGGIVRALAVHDDGGEVGPAIYAAGDLLLAPSSTPIQIAYWDGFAWAALESGMNGTVFDLEPFGGALPGLYAGGQFTTSSAGDSFLARWGGCGVREPLEFCFGDDSGAACPCGNPGASGAGCMNSTGSGARLASAGLASASLDTLTFIATNLPPGQPALLFAGDNAVAGGDGAPFGDGLRCAGGNVRRFGIELSNAAGNTGWGPGLAPPGGWTPGDTLRFQTWLRDPVAGPCGFGFNTSQGIERRFSS